MLESAISTKLNGKAIQDRDLDELDELEDLEDDRVLESYRRQRLAEMQSELSNAIFGSVLQISKPDYQREITLASASHWVVLHLYQEYAPGCKLVNAILDRLASQFKSVKFCKAVATMTIENYPDRNCPTLLIYGKGELVKQIIGMEYLGGLDTTVAKVHGLLASIGALPMPTLSDGESHRRVNFVAKSNHDESDEDSD